MIYGYARISTPSQSIERQERNISAAYPSAHIVKEAYTGKTMNRPEWVKLMKHVGEGDTIVFDSVSRMARNADEGIETYMDLMDKGVELVFLKEQTVNTATYKAALLDAVPMTGDEIADLYIDATNKAMRILAKRQIRVAFEQAQKEVDDLRERTKEGIVTAKLNGKKPGRQTAVKVETKKAIAAKAQILKHYNVFGGAYDADHTMHELEKHGVKISRNSFFKYVRELKTEGAAE